MKEAARLRGQKNYEKNPLVFQLSAARRRAKKRGVPFSLSVEDVVVPELCPVLGIKLGRSRGRQAPGSPTIDRLIPALGYVPGNVRVISYRANLLKSNATAEELRAVLADLEKINVAL